MHRPQLENMADHPEGYSFASSQVVLMACSTQVGTIWVNLYHPIGRHLALLCSGGTPCAWFRPTAYPLSSLRALRPAHQDAPRRLSNRLVDQMWERPCGRRATACRLRRLASSASGCLRARQATWVTCTSAFARWETSKGVLVPLVAWYLLDGLLLRLPWPHIVARTQAGHTMHRLRIHALWILHLNVDAAHAGPTLTSAAAASSWMLRWSRAAPCGWRSAWT